MTAEPLKPLPCPWCQKPPTIRNVFNMFGMVESVDVYCPEHTHGFRGKTQQEAIAAWNTRAEPDELPEWLVRKLNEKLMPGSRPWNYETKVIMNTLEWVLSLRRDKK